MKGKQTNIPDLRSDYEIAKARRYKRARMVPSQGASANYHFRTQIEYIRGIEIARDIDRNDRVVGQGISRLVSNVVRKGIMLNPTTGNTDLDSTLQAKWHEWGQDRDLVSWNGESNFHQMERLALRSSIVDGDICFLPQDNGTLRAVEAHRLRTPHRTRKNIVHGVETNTTGIPVRYWLAKKDETEAFETFKASELQPVKARDSDLYRQVFHIYDPKRFSQRRGVTALAPIADSVTLHDDIQLAKLVQAQMTSAFAVIREREQTTVHGDPYTENAAKGPQSYDVTGGVARLTEAIGLGMEITAQPGETIKGFSPNVPNPEFFEHAHMILTFIAINLDLPVHVLLLDASQTNFSGWRGAIDQARLGFMDIQDWLSSKFHREVYLWKLRQWIDLDPELKAAANDASINLFSHEWNPPAWPYIEPVKDAQSDVIRLSNSLASPRRVYAERGMDWEREYSATIDDRANAITAAIEKAREINAGLEEGEQVSWKELLPMPGLEANSPPVEEEKDADGSVQDVRGVRSGSETQR